MKKKLFTEQELLEGLDAESVHADELAILLPQELPAFEWLTGSDVSYERPFDPAREDCFDSNEDAPSNP